MLSNFFKAIGSFFKALFGGGSKKTTPNPTTTMEPANPNVPQDGSEIQPDTIVVVANETEPVIIDPNVPDKEFDDDVADIPVVEEPVADNKSIPTDEVEEEEPPVVDEPVVEEPIVDEPAIPSHKQRFLWCLDNGHGKLTAGKRSPVFDDGETQFFEYEFNRDIVARIIKQLKEKGVAFFNVVPEVEVGNILEERVNRANSEKSKLPKLFVSIHANAAPAKSSKDWAPASIKGIETWYFHNSKKGQKVASIFQKHLIDETGFNNRHLKSRPDRQFYVLRKTRMTAVLTENGFYNNKAEAAALMTDEVRQQIADAHVKAILEIEENGIS